MTLFIITFWMNIYKAVLKNKKNKLDKINKLEKAILEIQEDGYYLLKQNLYEHFQKKNIITKSLKTLTYYIFLNGDSKESKEYLQLRNLSSKSNITKTHFDGYKSMPSTSLISKLEISQNEISSVLEDTKTCKIIISRKDYNIDRYILKMDKQRMAIMIQKNQKTGLYTFQDINKSQIHGIIPEEDAVYINFEF